MARRKWTEQEINIVSRADITIQDMMHLTRRTKGAIMVRQSELRKAGTVIPHRNRPWTPEEITTIARDDLTHREAARLTGRTLYAVRNKRLEVRTDKARK